MVMNLDFILSVMESHQITYEKSQSKEAIENGGAKVLWKTSEDVERFGGKIYLNY